MHPFRLKSAPLRLCILAFLRPSGGGLLGFAWARPGLLMAPHNLILGLFSFLPALPGSSWPVLWLAEPSSLEPSVQHPLVALSQPSSWRRAAPLPRAACQPAGTWHFCGFRFVVLVVIFGQVRNTDKTNQGRGSMLFVFLFEVPPALLRPH